MMRFALFRLRRGSMRWAVVSLAAFLMIVSWPLPGANALAGDKPPKVGKQPLTQTWKIARGGRLYDNWLAELEADTPKGSHPAYPATGKMKGYVSWRCVECHGWDRRGADGAYGSGLHYTGIKGVTGVRGMKPAEIEKIVRNKTHGFTENDIPDKAMKRLTLFLSKGQIDTDKYIDRKTRAAKGHAERGAPIFQTTCAVCHGLDGTEIKFSSPGDPPYLGPTCRKNPWKVLHKMRSGQPDVAMISLTSLSIQRQIDVLAYCQRLPEE